MKHRNGFFSWVDMIIIDHCKEIQELTFQMLAFHKSELRANAINFFITRNTRILFRKAHL